jgi:hypothetical protein
MIQDSALFILRGHRDRLMFVLCTTFRGRSIVQPESSTKLRTEKCTKQNFVTSHVNVCWNLGPFFWIDCHCQGDMYTRRKIYPNLGYVTVRGEGKMERARGEQYALFAIASPLSPFCISNGQRSSEISCDKYIS